MYPPSSDGQSELHRTPAPATPVAHTTTGVSGSDPPFTSAPQGSWEKCRPLNAVKADTTDTSEFPPSQILAPLGTRLSQHQSTEGAGARPASVPTPRHQTEPHHPTPRNPDPLHAHTFTARISRTCHCRVAHRTPSCSLHTPPLLLLALPGCPSAHTCHVAYPRSPRASPQPAPSHGAQNTLWSAPTRVLPPRRCSPPTGQVRLRSPHAAALSAARAQRRTGSAPHGLSAAPARRSRNWWRGLARRRQGARRPPPPACLETQSCSRAGRRAWSARR